MSEYASRESQLTTQGYVGLFARQLLEIDLQIKGGRPERSSAWRHTLRSYMLSVMVYRAEDSGYGHDNPMERTAQNNAIFNDELAAARQYVPGYNYPIRRMDLDNDQWNRAARTIQAGIICRDPGVVNWTDVIQGLAAGTIQHDMSADRVPQSAQPS